MRVNPPRRRFSAVAQILRKPQQDAHRELIIQKTAFDIAGIRDRCSGVEADDIAHLHAERTRILRAFYIFVQHDLRRIKAALGRAVFAVDMHRRITKLERAVDNPARAGIDAHIFRFAVFRAHAAERCDAQTAVSLHLCHHRAERISMRLQQKCVVCIFSAQIDQHAALGCDARIISHRGERILHPFCRPGGIARRAVDGQKSLCLFGCIDRILSVHFSASFPVQYV